MDQINLNILQRLNQGFALRQNFLLQIIFAEIKWNNENKIK